MKTKWDDLTYRVMPVKPGFEWFRYQVGQTIVEKRVPQFPAEPILNLLGFGPTMEIAEQMAEKALGR